MTKEIPRVERWRNTHIRRLAKIRATHNRHFCVYIGERIDDYAKKLLFGTTLIENFDCILLHYKKPTTIGVILRDVGIASSISQAKGAGWLIPVPYGFNDYWFDGLKDVTARVGTANNLGYVGNNMHRMTILNNVKPDKQNGTKKYTATM